MSKKQRLTDGQMSVALDLKGALAMVVQAAERLDKSDELRQELDDLYDELDSLKMSVEDAANIYRL